MKVEVKILASATALALIAGTAFADPVTLEVTAWKGNEAEPAGLPDLIKKFEAENPDIKIDFSYIGRLDTDTVLPPRLQGNNPPDVMMTDMPLVKLWGEAGLLADLGTDSEWYGHISESLKEPLTTNGAAYIMPLEVIGMGNFVNMGLLKKAGVDDAPTTIDQLKESCGKLADAGIEPLIFTGGFSAPLFVAANGLESSDVSASDLGSGASKFADNASFNATISLIRDLVEARCFDPAAQAGLDPWSTGLNEFAGGNFAMMPQGAWNIAAFKKVEGLDFVFAPIPSAKDSGVALDLFGIGWSVAKVSEHQDEARKFVEFFAKPESLKALADAEAAYSPFDDGVSGMPDLAKPYDTARNNGGIINFPIALLQWPKPLEKEMWDSLTSFLLDTSQDSKAILTRWDEAVEDSM
ncbi:extracellular solute-binding protein [Shinella sp. 838]|uniref:ABC transporter substrate-binding protein n=1 Tax=Shinella sp. 838 TaxID=3038164 RepID=UPI002414F70A|nr:extracellular solute-binding protein [Shinella sp. 838]MDG4674920.1 extracellular solute-binding protein [Shinella sp. 838]